MIASGVGRSGTTVLRKALGEHPLLHSTDCENNIIYDVLKTARHNCTFPSRQATMRVPKSNYDRQFRLLLLHLLWPKVMRGKQRPQGIMAASDLTAKRADYLLEAFPQARIVYIIRNGIAVLSSRMSHPNFCHVPFAQHCQIWTRAQEMVAWGADSAHNSSFCLVRQEELLDAAMARKTFERIFADLNLPFCQAGLDVVLQKTFHPTSFQREDVAKSNDLTKRGERWRLWTTEQRKTFESVCGDAMRELGYEIPW